MKNIKSFLSVLLMVAMLLAIPTPAAAQKSVDPDCVTACFYTSFCQWLDFWGQLMCEMRCIGFCSEGGSISQTAEGSVATVEQKQSVCTTNLQLVWKEKKGVLLLKDYDGLTTKVKGSMFLPLRYSTPQ